MKNISLRIILAALAVLGLHLSAVAGTLDDFYLQQFGVQTARNGDVLQKTGLSPAAETGEIPHCGTPLKHKLVQDWNKLEVATQKVLAKQLAAPVLANPATFTSAGGHFTIHYATQPVVDAQGVIIRDDRPQTTDANANGVPDYVETVGQTFEEVATGFQTRGWRLAPTQGGLPYDIYLLDLGPQGLYGQTTAPLDFAVPSPGFPHAFASYIEIDNNYTEDIFTQNGAFTPLESLQITATHEYHHSIQYGYNIFFDVWYAEASASWHEDELYPDVNQLYNYIRAWFTRPVSNSQAPPNTVLPLDTPTNVSTGGGYGRWIFNRYLAERFGLGIVRTIWDRLPTMDPPVVNGIQQDIPMTPVIDSVLSSAPQSSSLAAEFFGFAKRVYDRNWSTHTADISLIHPYTPVGTYSAYPVNSSSSPAPSVTLPHYSFAYYKFTPAAAVADLTITITKTDGIQTAVFKKAAGVISEITANTGGGSYTISGFGALNPASEEVVLLIVNTTNTDSLSATFSSDSSSTPTPTPTPVASGGGGGGGGCFIATAAYGSYLHPQVQVLRDFRDNYLLTSEPGRALVALYYRVSPPAADFIARHDMLRLMVRLLLTPLIFAVKFPVAGGLALLATAGSILFVMRRRHRRYAPKY